MDKRNEASSSRAHQAIAVAMTSSASIDRDSADVSSRPHRVAFAHSRRGAVAELIAAIGPTWYDIVDVVVRKTLVDELAEHDPDAVIIDDRLGHFDVRRLCRDVRRSIGARILVLAAEPLAADEAWMVQVIEAGADDVMAGSISGALLRTHLLALMRSAPERDRTVPNIVIGDVEVDVDGYAVFVAGRLVRFPRLQFTLLLVLARRPNKVVSLAQLLTEVWGIESRTVNPRRVRVAASILRRLLGEGPRRPRVETVSRIGYRLIVPV